jgi:hypothetical protein
MNSFAQQIFYGLVVELIILFITYVFKERKIIAIIVFAVGTVLAGVVAFVPLPTEPGLSLYVYDDFDDQRYEGSFNKELWMPLRYDNDNIIQQNGSLVISDIADHDDGVILYFRDEKQSEFSYFEARMKISDKTYKGDGVALVLMVTSPSIPFQDHIWYSLGAWPAYQVSVSKGGTGEVMKLKQVDVREWHVLGIEFKRKTRILNFIFDGEIFYSYMIPGDEIIFIEPALQVWRAEGNFVEGYIDYIKLYR